MINEIIFNYAYLMIFMLVLIVSLGILDTIGKQIYRYYRVWDIKRIRKSKK